MIAGRIAENLYELVERNGYFARWLAACKFVEENYCG